MEIASGCTNKIVNIDIPTKITNLKILDCGYNSLDNLPSNIEILQIGGFIHYPLLNLPVNLKKLIIHNENQEVSTKDIKLPFGCQLIITK